MTPTEAGPPRSSAPARPAAAASSASGQVASTRTPSTPRTSGSVIRSGAWMKSKAKRPLSHSQPWLSGSEATPRERTNRSVEDCNATRQPTAHSWHDDSTDDRSHGRARNRYGDASSAPTGQIWTVFPEKYDRNGSVGKV